MAGKGKKHNSSEKGSTGSEMMSRFKSNPLVFIGTIFVLVIVVIAFVFIPAMDRGGGGRSSSIVFGSYGGIPIKYVPRNYLAQQYEYLARYYQGSINEQNAE